MTMGEFAKKYAIPYGDVQRASFRTATRQNCGGRGYYGLDFEERELKTALRSEMESRIVYHTEMITKAQRALSRLNGGGTE